MNNQLRIINCLDGIRKRDIIDFHTKENVHIWFQQLVYCIDEHSRWKHAAINFQRIQCSENSCSNTSTRNSFAGSRRQGSLYDEIPLVGNAFYKVKKLFFLCLSLLIFVPFNNRRLHIHSVPEPAHNETILKMSASEGMVELKHKVVKNATATLNSETSITALNSQGKVFNIVHYR